MPPGDAFAVICLVSKGVPITTLEEIVENMKAMPESAQAEVLEFIEFLKYKERNYDDSQKWSGFSLASAVRGISEEPSPYGEQDIKEKF
jgi:hypothetical protein